MLNYNTLLYRVSRHLHRKYWFKISCIFHKKQLTYRASHGKVDNGLAAVAQEVAHLIGSEEVTGSTPVSSFLKTLENDVFKPFSEIPDAI